MTTELKTPTKAPKTAGVSAPEPRSSISFSDILKSIAYIVKGVELNQPRLIQRAIRQNAIVRRFVTKELLIETVEQHVPTNSPVFEPMRQFIAKLPDPVVQEAMVVDGTSETEPKSVLTFSIPPASVLPEVEVFIFTLIVTTLLREKFDTEAAFASTVLIERIKSFNRRSLDLLSSKAYFYFSLSHEKIDRLENIRSSLLALYRTTCIRHDEMGQAVLLNLLLRNYLHYNLIEQAHVLSLRTTFPENASNNQFCRFLYYMGRIQAIQLEYSESYQRLFMAGRKAPPDVGVDFSIMVNKLAVIVQLLMGDIPERSLFNQKEFRGPLQPYLVLTQAVRNGDLQQFDTVVAKYGAAFAADKNMVLIRRLGHNVLKTGLRKLSLSYSRISLEDVAAKLHLPSASSAGYICAKAIRDGVIEATIEQSAGVLVSSEIVDVYSTEEPQKVFHKRIAFCLDVYNEAVKSMRYPPDAYKKELQQNRGKGTSSEEKTIDELIKEFEEEMED